MNELKTLKEIEMKNIDSELVEWCKEHKANYDCPIPIRELLALILERQKELNGLEGKTHEYGLGWNDALELQINEIQRCLEELK